MSSYPPFAPRPLDALDHDRARDVAVAAGAHGVYVGNGIAVGSVGGGRNADHVLGLYAVDGLAGIAFFGNRGNLVLIEREPLDPEALAAAVRDSAWAWRIALGSPTVVDLLARGDSRVPIVHRTQVYYAIERGEDFVPAPPPDDGRGVDAVRLATRADHRALVAAALELNEADLNVEPWRVNHTWLRDSVRRRIRAGHTWVIGPEGAPICKLDIGSFGPAGAVVEGVYTDVAERGRGHATRLVRAVASRLLGDVPAVCLHVAESNTSARRAYEAAGMDVAASCRLLLRG